MNFNDTITISKCIDDRLEFINSSKKAIISLMKDKGINNKLEIPLYTELSLALNLIDISQRSIANLLSLLGDNSLREKYLSREKELEKRLSEMGLSDAKEEIDD